MHEYNIHINNDKIENLQGKFDAVVLGVAHKEYLNINIRNFLKDSLNGVIYDVKGVLDRNIIDGRL